VVERMKELRPALARPDASWKLTWTTNEFTGGKEVPNVVSSMFLLKHLAEFEADLVPLYLALGDNGSAAGSVGSMLDICGHYLEAKPSVISLLMAGVMMQNIEECLWEGVRRGQWSVGQLASFETRLAAMDVQACASRCFRGEVAFARWKSKAVSDLLGESDPKKGIEWREGWAWDGDRIVARCRAIWRELRPRGVDVMKLVEGDRIFFDHAARSNGRPRTRFTFEDLEFFRQRHAGCPVAYFASDSGWYSEQPDLESTGWANLENLATTSLLMEARIGLARTGMALERRRLSRGKLPDSLGELVPGDLARMPVDPFDGKPLRYFLQADGSPRIWSIGPDLLDEGGLPHRNRNSKGDLVWMTRPIPGFTERNARRGGP
jgi:hypothetical protein